MEDTFKLSDKNICLYGYIEALGQTERFRNSIKSLGVSISFIIDKRAPLLNNPLIVTFEDFMKKCGDKNQWAFILCLWDAKTQESIASNLSEHGFDNIVFCPFSDIYNESLASAMRWIYNEVRYNTDLNELTIPKYSSLINCNELKPITALSHNDFRHFGSDRIELWVPIKFIYSAIKPDNSDDFEYDTHISKASSYNELYDYVTGKSDIYPAKYLSHNLRGRNEKDFLENRALLFKEFSIKLDKTPHYFAESPIESKWNEKGYFNMIDGHHRALFLYRNGYEKLPLVISTNDYEKYKDALIH